MENTPSPSWREKMQRSIIGQGKQQAGGKRMGTPHLGDLHHALAFRSVVQAVVQWSVMGALRQHTGTCRVIMRRGEGK